MWGKTDDKFHAHRKTKRALKGHPNKARDAAPLGLWVQAQSYCGDGLTDGYVPTDELDRWDDDGEHLAARLVDSGLWHPAVRLHDGTVLLLAHCESPKCGVGLERADPDDPRTAGRLAEPGFLFHDWKQCNPLKVRVERDQLANRIRAELHRDAVLVLAIKKRDKNRCRYCGTEVNWRARRGPNAATYDHVKPIAQGGTNVLDNVVVACQQCNDRKGARTLREAKMKLLPPGSLGGPTPDLDDDDETDAGGRIQYGADRPGLTDSSGDGSGRVGSGSKNVSSTGVDLDQGTTETRDGAQ